MPHFIAGLPAANQEKEVKFHGWCLDQAEEVATPGSFILAKWGRRSWEWALLVAGSSLWAKSGCRPCIIARVEHLQTEFSSLPYYPKACLVSGFQSGGWWHPVTVAGLRPECKRGLVPPGLPCKTFTMSDFSQWRNWIECAVWRLGSRRVSTFILKRGSVCGTARLMRRWGRLALVYRDYFFCKLMNTNMYNSGGYRHVKCHCVLVYRPDYPDRILRSLMSSLVVQ